MLILWKLTAQKQQLSAWKNGGGGVSRLVGKVSWTQTDTKKVTENWAIGHVTQRQALCRKQSAEGDTAG